MFSQIRIDESRQRVGLNNRDVFRLNCNILCSFSTICSCSLKQKMKLLLLFCIIFVAICHYSAAGMVGGWSDMSDVNSSNFQKIVSFAAKKMSEASNSVYLLKPIEILNAKKQVSF